MDDDEKYIFPPPSKRRRSELMRRVRFCYNKSGERQDEMKFTVEYEQEEDGRWLAEVKELPGVLVYGKDPDDAAARAQALALRVVADRLENGESASSLIFTFEMA